MIISLIAIIDEHQGLGKDNSLLCHLPADLKRFKALTMGKPIVMGRKTFDSIGKPLPGRVNIVLTHHALEIEGVTIMNSLDVALKSVASEPEVMIIGGAQVYQQAMGKAHRIYLTKIHHQFDADVYFPKLDVLTWKCVEEVFYPSDEKNKYAMTFYEYHRIT